MAERSLSGTMPRDVVIFSRPSGSYAPLRLSPGSSADSEWRLQSMPTDISERCGVLVRAIASQKKLLDYNGHYIAYLLDHITEEAFQESANAFVVASAEYADMSQLTKHIRLLLGMTHLPFSPHELADICACPEQQIASAIQSLQSQHFLGA